MQLATAPISFKLLPVVCCAVVAVAAAVHAVVDIVCGLCILTICRALGHLHLPPQAGDKMATVETLG